MLFFILLFNLSLIFIKTLECQVIELQEDQIFYTQINQVILIEKDDENEDYVEYRINQNIIEKSFWISLYPSGQVIQSKVIESLDSKIKLKKWICHLMQSSSYFITYTNIFELNDIIEQSNNQIVEINSKSEEICEEFFGNQNYQFIVFCYTFIYVNIYSVHIVDNQTKLLQQFDFSNLNIILCQRFYEDLKNFEYIFAFYQCENWNIIYFNGNSSQVLLNQTILQQINLTIQIKLLNDIKICFLQDQLFLVLIEEDFYCLFDPKNLIINAYYYNQKKIKKIVIKQNCYQIFSVTESNTGQIFIQNEQFFNNSSSSFQIHYVNKQLFLQNEYEISRIFTTHINYTIQIQNKQIKFIQQLNYFYQIDEESRQIQFYKYNDLNSFIKPTKKYLYLYQVDQIYFQLQFFSCYKFFKKWQDDSQICQIESRFSNICQNIILFNIKKDLKIKNTFYEIQIPKMLETITNNQQIFERVYKCKPALRKLNYTLLAFSNTSALYIKQNNLKFSSCSSNCQDMAFKINKMSLFSNNGVFVLLKKEAGQAIRIYIDTNDCLSIMTYDLQFTPQKVFQYGNNLIMVREAQFPLIFIMYPIQQIQHLQQLKEKLYLFDQIDYYQQIGHHTYIQYQQILIQEYQQSLNYYKINDSQVIYIFKIGIGSQVLAVHRIQNILIQYYIENFHIHNSGNITFYNYSLIRPLVYQLYNTKIILLASQNQQLYLLIIELYNLQIIQWIKSIKSNSENFFIKESYLIYQDENNQMKQISIDTINIEIKNVNSTQSKFFDEQTHKIQLLSNFNYEQKECLLHIEIYNECKKLQLNEYYEKQLVNNKIAFNNYFYGPIYRISIQNNQNVKIKGPFLEIQQLQECISISDLNCILKKQFKTNQKLIECYFMIEINQFNLLFCQDLIRNLNQITQRNEQNLNQLIFQISNYSLIYFQSLEDQKGFSYQVFYYDKMIGSFKQESIENKDIKIDINYPIEIQKIGNLIIFQNEHEQQLFSLQIRGLNQIFSKHKMKKLIKIENQENLLISLEMVKQLIRIEIKFYLFKLEGTKISLQGLMSLDCKELYNLTELILSYNSILGNFDILKENDIMLLKGFVKQNYIHIQISQRLGELIIFYDINFDKQYNFQSGSIDKIIRNCQKESQIIYKDDSILIIDCKSKRLIYDLRVDKQFYDPVQEIVQNNKNIHLFNTTHVIFQTVEINQFFFGQFGYEIYQETQKNDIETFTLEVQNDVTTIQIELQLINTEIVNGFVISLNELILCFFIFLMIFLLIYCIRRCWLQKSTYMKVPKKN